MEVDRELLPPNRLRAAAWALVIALGLTWHLSQTMVGGYGGGAGIRVRPFMAHASLAICVANIIVLALLYRAAAMPARVLALAALLAIPVLAAFPYVTGHPLMRYGDPTFSLLEALIFGPIIARDLCFAATAGRHGFRLAPLFFLASAALTGMAWQVTRYAVIAQTHGLIDDPLALVLVGGAIAVSWTPGPRGWWSLPKAALVTLLAVAPIGWFAWGEYQRALAERNWVWPPPQPPGQGPCQNLDEAACRQHETCTGVFGSGNCRPDGVCTTDHRYHYCRRVSPAQLDARRAARAECEAKGGAWSAPVGGPSWTCR